MNKALSLIVKKIPLNSWTTHFVAAEETLSFFSTETMELLRHSPSLISWKNTAMKFLGCNLSFARMANLSSPEAIVGKADADFSWGEKAFLDIFITEDQEVLSGKILYILGKYRFFDKERIVLVKKIPIFNDKQEITGIVNYWICFYSENLANILLIFHHYQIDVSKNLLDNIKKLFFRKCFELSPREEECAYYLLKGFSAKEIGKFLNLSYRTVEVHLNKLKEKFDCKKTTSLIIKLVELGFLETLTPLKIAPPLIFE